MNPPEMMYHYKASLDRVVDGDTVDLNVDLGFTLHQQHRFRLFGINAPEMKGATLEAARAAKTFLENILVAANAAGQLYIETERDKSDSFGRYLVKLYAPMIGVTVDPLGPWTHINDLLVQHGHAIPYRR